MPLIPENLGFHRQALVNPPINKVAIRSPPYCEVIIASASVPRKPMMVAMFTSWSSSLKNIPGFGAGVRRCPGSLQDVGNRSLHPTVIVVGWRNTEGFKCFSCAEFWFIYSLKSFAFACFSILHLLTCFFLALHCQGMSGVRCRTALAGEQRWWSGDLLLSAQESFVTPGGPWGHDIFVASRQKHPRTWGSDWDLLRWLFGMKKSIIY